MQMDGDKTTVFHDVDGTVSEYPGAFLVKEDNWLLRHPDCIDVPDWRAAICSGRYAQVRGAAVATVTCPQYSVSVLVFTLGDNKILHKAVFVYQSTQIQYIYSMCLYIHLSVCCPCVKHYIKNWTLLL